MDRSKVRFHCPGYEALYDKMGRIPNDTQSGVPYSYTVWALASYDMNQHFVTCDRESDDWVEGRFYARLSSMKSGTMLMQELSVHSTSQGKFHAYYNPNHGDRVPVLFADGRVELREEVPACPHWYSADDVTDEDTIEYYGYYMIR